MGRYEVVVGGRGFELGQGEQARLHDPPYGSLAGVELLLDGWTYGVGWAGWPCPFC
jgi:hypothetical protein